RDIPRLREALAAAAHELAQLAFGARYVEAPPEWVVVRVEPATPDSAEHARQVARALALAWADWGATIGYTRRAGAWSVSRGEGDAWAVAAGVPGLQDLVGAIAGHAQATVSVGPDVVSRLARVDVLPPSDAPAIDRLAAADAEWNAWRAARRRGDPIGPNPRPA